MKVSSEDLGAAVTVAEYLQLPVEQAQNTGREF